MIESGSRTVEPSLRSAARVLHEAGIERARIEAEILLAHVLEVGRPDLIAHPDRVLAVEQVAVFDGMVRRRAGRYPLPYLTGTREFMGLSFRVREGVLIPRPETEALVEAAVDALREAGRASADAAPDLKKVREGGESARGPAELMKPPAAPVAVDVGTGSGIVAISIAHFVPRARVLATDISPAACALARANARRLGVADRVEVLEGDLLSPIEKLCGAGAAPEERAMVICANLPYIPEENISALQPEVREWEPMLALAGGPGGLDVIERLVRQAPDCLRPGGRLICEIGSEADQAARLTSILQAHGGWKRVDLLRDLAGLPRVVAATLEP